MGDVRLRVGLGLISTPFGRLTSVKFATKRSWPDYPSSSGPLSPVMKVGLDPDHDE